jgi:hypothetical protein
VSYLASTDKLQLVTDAAADVDVLASYADYDASGNATVNRSPTPSITTAATTDILAAPPASTFRHLKDLLVANTHATVSVNITVLFHNGVTTWELWSATLAPGECFCYGEKYGSFVKMADGTAKPPNATSITSVSTADQVVGGSTTALLTGSTLALPLNRLKPGTILKWIVTMTKTAAGTAAMTFDVRFGTNGSTADIVRLGPYSSGAQTATADTAEVEIRAVVRGPIGSACVVHGQFELGHNLAASGFAPTAEVVLESTSAAFDITPAGTKASVVLVSGTSHSFTVKQVIASIENLL